jgi:hypothetical protein
VNSIDYLNKLELAARLGMMRRRKIPFIALGHRTVRFHWPTVEKALGRLEHKAIGQEAK